MGAGYLIILLAIAGVLPYGLKEALAGKPATTNFPWKCPLSCRCQSLEAVVNCSALEFSAVPTDMPADVSTLDLSRNAIRQLSIQSLNITSGLRHVDLSFNAITDLASDVFSHLVNLHTIALRSCSLTSEMLNNFNWSRVQIVDLSNNNLSLMPMLSENVYEVQLDNNAITNMNRMFFDMHPALSRLSLSLNLIGEITLVWGGGKHDLRYFNLSSNRLRHITSMSLDGLVNLRILDLSYNYISYLPIDIFVRLFYLENLRLAGNPLLTLPDAQFSGCASLSALDLSHLSNLTSLGRAFDELDNLKNLKMSDCYNLRVVVGDVFVSLLSLELLDLSHSSVTWLTDSHLASLPLTVKMNFTGTFWSCDCSVAYAVLISLANQLKNDSALCSEPTSLRGNFVWDPKNFIDCQQFNLTDHLPLLNSSDMLENISLTSHLVDLSRPRDAIVQFKAGSSAVLVCNGNHDSQLIQWRTPQKILLAMGLESEPVANATMSSLSNLTTETIAFNVSTNSRQRVQLLNNGSLVIKNVVRADAGLYLCSWGNFSKNESFAIHFRLDYDIIFSTKIKSMLFGATCAGLFLVFGILVCSISYISFRCSKEEREKRQSIRQLLDRIQDYKTEKIGRLSAYRSAKIGQISAFRTAKMDQLSAYRTAKMDQISAYRTAKLDKLFAFKTAKLCKLRTYKQMTMTNILHHMDRMREHYALQSSKVKENCARQAKSLRHKYRHKIGRFKDYRSHQIERLRENYRGQMTRIHEYSSQQMEKLREQYRVQQQYIIKLMELLEIGNCVSVVDAECMRTESMLFDPTLALQLDLDAGQLPDDDDEDDDCDSMKETQGSSTDGDEYMTASVGDLSNVDEISVQVMDNKSEYMQTFDLGDDDSMSDMPYDGADINADMVSTISKSFEECRLEAELNNYLSQCSSAFLEDGKFTERDRVRSSSKGHADKAFVKKYVNSSGKDGNKRVQKSCDGKGSKNFILEAYLEDSERIMHHKNKSKPQASRQKSTATSAMPKVKSEFHMNEELKLITVESCSGDGGKTLSTEL